MPDIAASDVTITVEDRQIIGKQRRNRVKIAFGNGSLTYPNAAGGVPMPAASSFGMKRNLDYLTIFDENDASGLWWKYNKENGRLRGYEFDYPNAAEGPALELDAADAPAAQVFYAEAVGW